MQTTFSRAGTNALLSAVLLCMVLGSVHAFSVFLEPLEAGFAISRSTTSLTYSFALVAITLAVLMGPRFFSRLSAWLFVMGIGLLAALGAVIAAYSGSLAGVWLGYSVIFGIANGLGYGFGLQIAAQANPGREGMAMGIVTAAYALGAAVSPIVFQFLLEWGGFRADMLGLAGILLVTTPNAAFLIHKSRVKFRTVEFGMAARAPTRDLLLLWCGYGAGVAAGLMAIGHATGIATVIDPDTPAWLAPAILALSNLIGSLAIGKVTDTLAPRNFLIALPGLSALVLLVLTFATSAGPLYFCLALLGFAYGGSIAAYPAVIAKRVGMAQSARIYGKVFTAWGAAGLCAPWLAGVLFDWTQTYTVALIFAALLACISAFAAIALFRDAAG